MARKTKSRSANSDPDPSASEPADGTFTDAAELDHRIVEETLALAAEVGWEGVRLRLVAERLGVPLNAVAGRYRDLDAVADAWLGRGVAAMLAPMPADFAERPAAERVETVILRFLDTLAPHRRVTAAMVAAKLWPGHPHHWAPLVFNLSRTVHWIREAALLDARGMRRQIEEVSLTALLVAVFAVWSLDRSEGQRRTRSFLQRRLRRGSRCLARLACRPRRSWRPDAPDEAAREPEPA